MAKINESGREKKILVTESMDLENEDLISRLPDEVLSAILSGIEPKYAARTCALSTRWRYLWAFGPILKFVMPSCENQIDVNNYMDFVDRIVDLRKGLKVHEFHFDCLENCVDDRVSGLICNVLKLDINVLNLDFEHEEGFKLPPVLFQNCASLVQLCLSGDVVLDVPANVSFPNLKILKLRLVTYSNEASISNLVAGCAGLEELFVERCLTMPVPGDNMMTFMISSTSLKVLRLLFSFDDDSHICEGEQCKFTTMIDAPNLESLRFDDHISGDCLINNTLPLLVEAHVDLDRSCENPWDFGSHGDGAFGVMTSVSAVKSLFLSGYSLRSLNLCNHDLDELPLFDNLVRLELGLDYAFGWLLFAKVLDQIPNLEALIFAEGFVRLSDVDLNDLSKDFVWDLPQNNIPACLVFKIKTIQINNFLGRKKEELRFVRYLLKNAMVLSQMKIKVLDGVDLDPSMRDNLLKSFRWSSSCHVDIS